MPKLKNVNSLGVFCAEVGIYQSNLRSQFEKLNPEKVNNGIVCEIYEYQISTNETNLPWKDFKDSFCHINNVSSDMLSESYFRDACERVKESKMTLKKLSKKVGNKQILQDFLYEQFKVKFELVKEDPFSCTNLGVPSTSKKSKDIVAERSESRDIYIISELQGLKQRLANFEVENLELKCKVDSFERKNLELKDRLDKIHTENMELECEAKDLNEENLELKSKLTNLQERKIELEETQSKDIKKCRRNELRKKDVCVSQFKRKYEMLEEERKKLESSKERLMFYNRKCRKLSYLACNLKEQKGELVEFVESIEEETQKKLQILEAEKTHILTDYDSKISAMSTDVQILENELKMTKEQSKRGPVNIPTMKDEENYTVQVEDACCKLMDLGVSQENVTKCIRVVGKVIYDHKIGELPSVSLLNDLSHNGKISKKLENGSLTIESEDSYMSVDDMTTKEPDHLIEAELDTVNKIYTSGVVPKSNTHAPLSKSRDNTCITKEDESKMVLGVRTLFEGKTVFKSKPSALSVSLPLASKQLCVDQETRLKTEVTCTADEQSVSETSLQESWLITLPLSVKEETN